MIFTVPAPEPEAVFTVHEQRKFHRTRFEVTVLTEERYEPQDLDDLARDIYSSMPDVDIKGRLSHLSTEVVTGAQAARELTAMDADPDFFGLDEHGNDLDEAEPDDDVEQVPLDDDPEVFDTDDAEEEDEEDDYEEDPEPVMV